LKIFQELTKPVSHTLCAKLDGIIRVVFLLSPAPLHLVLCYLKKDEGNFKAQAQQFVVVV